MEMKLKRFNPDFSLSISHELAYMRETPEGGYVAHGDYATLFSELEVVKAERDALAVENDRARKAVQIFSDATQELTEIIGDEIGMDGVAMLLAGFDAVGNMPATDAALSAIQLSIEESRFLTDVITAAGLLSCGKQDKGLARRIADFCVAKIGNSNSAELREAK